MKTVRLALTQPRSLRHPMHEFVVVHDGYEVSRLLHMNYVDGRSQTALFHVVGSPIDPYQAALEEADAVEEYEISRRQDEGFYLYVRGEPYEGDDRLVAAVRQRGLVTVMPVEFRADGTIRLTVVGPGDVVQESMGAIPDDIGVEVLAVGEYDARRFASGEGLTDRQYEAVQAAVDCGYYEEPRLAAWRTLPTNSTVPRGPPRSFSAARNRPSWRTPSRTGRSAGEPIRIRGRQVTVTDESQSLSERPVKPR